MPAPRQDPAPAPKPLKEDETATKIIRDRLARYHSTRPTKAPDNANYVAINFYWLDAALYVLKDHPSLVPVAVVLGHLPAFLEAPRTGKRAKSVGERKGWSAFQATAGQLAIFGLTPEKVRKGIKILKEAGLVKTAAKRDGLVPLISIRCGPSAIGQWKELYLERLREAVEP